jgi:hypothetical protein
MYRYRTLRIEKLRKYRYSEYWLCRLSKEPVQDVDKMWGNFKTWNDTLQKLNTYGTRRLGYGTLFVCCTVTSCLNCDFVLVAALLWIRIRNHLAVLDTIRIRIGMRIRTLLGNADDPGPAA